MNIESEWRDLIDRLTRLLGKPLANPLDGARLDAAVQPTGALPVERHLEVALQLATTATWPIAQPIDRIRRALCWRQNQNYSGADFLDGYAYCELVGPHGHVRHADIALGLLLLGPHVTYPEHAHPSTEIYAVVAGHTEWRQGDRVWRRRAPGDLIHHASMEPHAMRTSAEPLLAAYLWQDHLGDGARLVRESPT
jgi:hypothetical protein